MFQRPQNVKALQRFLGMLNFYRRFLPNLALIVRPLTEALRGSQKRYEWSNEMEKSFEHAKATLAQATLLAHPVEGAKLLLCTDASTKALGGCVAASDSLSP